MAKRDSYKTRIAHLAKSLERYGLHETVSLLSALGIVQRLREWCWANSTDVLERAADIDVVCPSPLPPCSLARVLVKAGFLGTVKGRFHMPSAYTERPTYADKRWRRYDKDGYRDAMRRAAKNNAVADIEFPPEPEPEQKDSQKATLFATKPPAPKKKRKRSSPNGAGTPGYKELVEYWFEKWAEIEGRGATYPFSAVDGKCIKDLIKRTDGIDHARQIIDAYLGCADRFYAGKMLKKLVGDLPRFVAAAKSPGPRNEIPYTGGDDLPRLD